MTKLRIGIDVGQRRNPTGIAVVETDYRLAGERSELHFRCRYLGRLPAGSTFPEVAERIRSVADGATERVGVRPWTYVNVTNVGAPFLDVLASCQPPGQLIPVYFNHGNLRKTEGRARIEKVDLGMVFLVSRLKVLLQTGRLHLPKGPEAQILAEELESYEPKLVANANDLPGAFRVGTQDDLVTALGLAVQVDREKVTRHGTRPRPPGL